MSKTKYDFKISFKDKDELKRFITSLAKVLEDEDENKNKYLCKCGTIVDKKNKSAHNRSKIHKENFDKVKIKETDTSKSNKIELEQN